MIFEGKKNDLFHYLFKLIIEIIDADTKEFNISILSDIELNYKIFTEDIVTVENVIEDVSFIVSRSSRIDNIKKDL